MSSSGGGVQITDSGPNWGVVVLILVVLSCVVLGLGTMAISGNLQFGNEVEQKAEADRLRLLTEVEAKNRDALNQINQEKAARAAAISSKRNEAFSQIGVLGAASLVTLLVIAAGCTVGLYVLLIYRRSQIPAFGRVAQNFVLLRDTKGDIRLLDVSNKRLLSVNQVDILRTNNQVLEQPEQPEPYYLPVDDYQVVGDE